MTKLLLDHRQVVIHLDISVFYLSSFGFGIADHWSMVLVLPQSTCLWKSSFDVMDSLVRTPRTLCGPSLPDLRGTLFRGSGEEEEDEELERFPRNILSC